MSSYVFIFGYEWLNGEMAEWFAGEHQIYQPFNHLTI